MDLSADGAIPMRLLRWECWGAIIAFPMTLALVLLPGSYEMAVFTFLAQPLFAIAAISYLLKVLAELRRHKSDVSCSMIGRRPLSLARR